MRISAKAQYACIAMLELAASQREPQPVHVRAIADAHGISQRFLVQILLQLKLAGLADSTRGAAGGYQLARPPEDVTLADIINAIDHPPPAKSALSGLLPSSAVQAVQTVLQEVHAKEQGLLEEITLADMLRRTHEHNVTSYQI
jgi:Rrf2 family protein